MMSGADHEARGMAQAAQADANRSIDLLEQHVQTCGERAQATITSLAEFREESRITLTAFREESREARRSQRDSIARLHQRVDAIPNIQATPAVSVQPEGNTVDKLEGRLWRLLALGMLVVVGYLITEGVPWGSI